jgi:DNA-binding CsgD family transcriptional regulator
MKRSLSPTELQIAELYCHGLIDKEISEQVSKPIWTVRNHKRHIYQKLGICTTHELVLYMVCKHLGKEWNLRELRLRGLSAILALLLLFTALLGNSPERQVRSARRANTSMRARTGRSQRGNEDIVTWWG